MTEHIGLFSALPAGHVLQTMMAEHQILLGFLDQLDTLQPQLASADPSRRSVLLQEIATLGGQLISAENHHQREEQILFPALEKLGIFGPTQAMIQEHVWLRSAKTYVVDLAATQSPANGVDFIGDLAAKMGYLSSMLRAHIAREDQILYPMAYDAIENSDDWDQMKIACDRVGYCPFTPNAEDSSSLLP